MMSAVIVQGIGLLATAATLASFAQHSDVRFRLFATIGSLLWAMHFALLDAHTAAVTALAIAARQGSSQWLLGRPVAWRTAAGLAFAAAFTAIAWWTWQAWYSILPWIAAVNGTYAYLGLTGTKLRAQMLLSDGAGLVNGFAVGSIGGVLASAAALLINASTIRRLLRRT
jgi:hypothetical protein